MKINPIAQGGNTNAGAAEVGRSAEKLAAAKAIAAGESPIRLTESDTPTDGQVKRIMDNRRKIKMKTNKSPERYLEEPIVTEAPVVATEAAPAPESAIPAPGVEAEPTIEDTKPLSPQFAALAKQRRAVQQERAQFLEEKKAFEASKDMSGYVSIADLQGKPLSVLQQHGVTYDKLTEAILANQDGVNPEIQELKAELKALKEGVDQKFVSREAQAEESALTEMLFEAEGLAKEGDAYELIRERDAYDKVLGLIHSTYKQSGRVLDVQDAMNAVESQLLDESLKYASYNKVKSKISAPNPAPTPTQQQPIRVMKTLTSRDNATIPMDKKARAVAAMLGTLKR